MKLTYFAQLCNAIAIVLLSMSASKQAHEIDYLKQRLDALWNRQQSPQAMHDVYKRDCGQLKPIYCLYEKGVWHGEKRNE